MFTTSPMKSKQAEVNTYVNAMRMANSGKTQRIRKSFDVTTRHSMGSSNKFTTKGFYENSFMKQAVKFHQQPESIFSHKDVMNKTLNGFKTVKLQNEQALKMKDMAVNNQMEG